MSLALLCVCVISAIFTLQALQLPTHDDDPTPNPYRVAFSALSVMEQTGAELHVDETEMRMIWQEQFGSGILVETQPISLDGQGASRLQVDLYAGGTQNIDGRNTYGFRAWLEVELYADGVPCASGRTELFLRSERERERLYSLVIDTAPMKADAYRLRWMVEPMQAEMPKKLPQGMLTFSRLDVMLR